MQVRCVGVAKSVVGGECAQARYVCVMYRKQVKCGYWGNKCVMCMKQDTCKG